MNPSYDRYRKVVSSMYRMADELESEGQLERAEQLIDLARSIAETTPNYERIFAAVPPGLLGDAIRLMEAVGVPYAVLGGIAVDVWGEPSETNDVDMLVDMSFAQQAHRWRDREFMRGFNFRPTSSKTGTIWRLDNEPRGGEVELLGAVNDLSKTALSRAVKTRSVLGEFTVVRPLDLVLLKALASTQNPSRLPRDTRHATSVIERQHLKLDDCLAEAPTDLHPVIRHFFNKATLSFIP